MRFLQVFFVSLLTVSSLQAQWWDTMMTKLGFASQKPPMTVKVLIYDEVSEVNVEVLGKFNIYDPYKNRRLATRFFADKADVRAMPNGIKWGEQFPGTYQIMLAPDSADTMIYVNGIPYLGKLYVYNVDNRLSVVNEVSLEDYIGSQLLNYTDRYDSGELLEAIAICERTNIVYDVISCQNVFWQVDADVVGYNGCSTNYNPLVEHAMQETNSLILSQQVYDKDSMDRLKPFPITVGSKQGAKKIFFDIERGQELAANGQDSVRILLDQFKQARVSKLDSYKHAALSSPIMMERSTQ